MRSVLHFLDNISNLECKKPVICDTNLERVKVEELQVKFLEYANEVNGCMEVLTIGLIEAFAFPPAFISPELLQFCIENYHVRSKSIVSKDGNTILSITREAIASIFQLTTNTFVAFSPTQALAK